MNSILEKYDNFLVDCDGVLWDGMIPINGSVEAIAKLKAAGKNVTFVTNNSTKTRNEYAAKFVMLGFADVAEDDINTSASSAAEYCANNGIQAAFVLGESGLKNELMEHGIEVVTDESDEFIDQVSFNKINLVQRVQAVVVGWYHGFDYRKLCIASLYLQNGAQLIGTNPDNNIMNGKNRMPANGCALAAIERSVDDIGGSKTFIAGKPNPEFMTRLLDKYSYDPARTLLIGDRLDTDIAFGKPFVDTMLVLSGCATKDDVDKYPQFAPTYICENIGAAL